MDTRALQEPWQLQRRSAASLTLTARDQDGEPVDLTDHVLTITPSGGDAFTASTADPEAGTRVWSLTGEQTDFAEGDLSISLDGDEWIVGPVWPSVEGTVSQDHQVSVTVGAAQITLTLSAAIGAGPGGSTSLDEDLVGFGSDENEVTGSAFFRWISSLRRLVIGDENLTPDAQVTIVAEDYEVTNVLVDFFGEQEEPTGWTADAGWTFSQYNGWQMVDDESGVLSIDLDLTTDTQYELRFEVEWAENGPGIAVRFGSNWDYIYPSDGYESERVVSYTPDGDEPALRLQAEGTADSGVIVRVVRVTEVNPRLPLEVLSGEDAVFGVDQQGRLTEDVTVLGELAVEDETYLRDDVRIYGGSLRIYDSNEQQQWRLTDDGALRDRTGSYGDPGQVLSSVYDEELDEQFAEWADAGVRWMGEWDNASYRVNDLVLRDGVLYVATEAHTGELGVNDPPDGPWTALADLDKVPAHNEADDAHPDIRALIDGKAPNGYPISVAAGIGPIIVDVTAVDGTATSIDLYGVDLAAINDDTALPDGLVLALSAPITGSPGGDLASVLTLTGDDPSIVAVVGAHAGVYALTPAILNAGDPWPELATPLGTSAGFYVNDTTRLLMSRTAYGWKTIDPLPVSADAVQFETAFPSVWEQLAETPITDTRSAIDLLASVAVDTSDSAGDIYLATSVAADPAWWLEIDDTDNDGAFTTPAVTDFATAVDLRMMFRADRPSGAPEWYSELFTQTHDGLGSWDNFELAVMWSGDSGGRPEGKPYLFWEWSKEGASVESGNFFVDAAIRPGLWLTVRMTQEFSTGEINYYREVPWEGLADDVTSDGRFWRLVGTATNANADSIDAGVTEPWAIGYRLEGGVAWCEVYDGIDGTKIVDIQESHLITAGAGATSITDGEGNVWTSTSGVVQPSLETRLAALE